MFEFQLSNSLNILYVGWCAVGKYILECSIIIAIGYKKDDSKVLKILGSYLFKDLDIYSESIYWDLFLHKVGTLLIEFCHKFHLLFFYFFCITCRWHKKLYACTFVPVVVYTASEHYTVIRWPPWPKTHLSIIQERSSINIGVKSYLAYNFPPQPESAPWVLYRLRKMKPKGISINFSHEQRLLHYWKSNMQHLACIHHKQVPNLELIWLQNDHLLLLILHSVII